MKIKDLLESKTQLWYHITRDWKKSSLMVNPRVNRIDDLDSQNDNKPFIAVCPTITQCIIGLGEWRWLGNVKIYSTQGNPLPASWVFDQHITQEHRFYEKKKFKFIKNIDLDIISKKLPNRITSGINDNEILKNIELDLIDLNKLNV